MQPDSVGFSYTLAKSCRSANASRYLSQPTGGFMRYLINLFFLCSWNVLSIGCGSSDPTPPSDLDADGSSATGDVGEDVAHDDETRSDTGPDDVNQVDGTPADAAAIDAEGPAVCGNGRADDGEACDGDDTRGLGCTAVGFTAGELGCRADCAAFDTSSCSNGCVPDCSVRRCGLDPVCGTLCGTCPNGSECSATGQCTDAAAVCGDGVREGGEVCDRGDLGGNTCSSLGYDRGALACAADCTSLVTTGCVADCVPVCGSRECGPDPTCGISCGVCAAGESCSAGACQADGPRGPRIITFNTNALEITDDQNVVFTAVVTDPDGIDDVIGGTLIDPATGRSYGSFATAASEGAYSLTLTWADIQRVRAINFTTVDETRTFRASFFDVSGASATAEGVLTLSCEGLGACDGVCTDITTTTNCGTCGTRCLTRGVCDAGVCGCPADFGECDGVCTSLTTRTDCGECDNACSAGLSCLDEVCRCPTGLALCGSVCRPQSTTSRCGGCSACATDQGCDDNVCVAPVDGAVRLFGDLSILQVYHLGEWKGVCDTDFDDNDGIVACRQMGMDYVGFLANRDPFPSVGFAMTGVPCTGTERSLGACYDSDAWRTSGGCFNDYVALTCNPSATPAAAVCPPRPAGSVLLNEVLFNPPGADGTGAAEWVELFGTPGLALKNYTLVGYDGATGNRYFTQPLDGQYLRAEGFLLLEGSGGIWRRLYLPIELQNGPDSMRLEYCDGSVVDALAYGSFGGGTVPRGEGTPEPAPATETSLARIADGVDTNNNQADWKTATSTTPESTNVPFALPITRSGTVTTSSSTFTRPSGACGTSTSTSYYSAWTITNIGDTTVNVTITANWLSGVDGFLAVYRGGFNAAAPTTNCAAADDDGTSAADSIVTISNWTVGQRLTLVMTSWNPGEVVGDYNWTISAL